METGTIRSMDNKKTVKKIIKIADSKASNKENRENNLSYRL